MEVLPCYGGAPHTSSVWSDVRVLIVDSDAQNLMNVKLMFEQCGYNKVAYVQTAEDALWLLQHTPIDLLLCQAFLPTNNINDMGGGGFQLLSAVKQDFKFCDLQVVLYSGHRQDDVMGSGYEMGIRALELGACAFYSNPISMEIVRHLWQHVFLKKIQSCDIIPPQQQPIWNVQRPESYNSSQVSSEKPKRKKSDKDDGVELMMKSKRMKKKDRMRWTEDLDRKFAAAVDEIRRSDPNGVTASRIRGLMKGMGEEGLTIPQINSHLQKYNKEKRSFCVDHHYATTTPQQLRDGDGDGVACGENDTSSMALQEWSDADLQELMMDTSDLSQLLSF